MQQVLFGSTGVRVSQLSLGAGSFGTGWGYGAQPDEAARMLDIYAEAGGNFIDGADAYQFGQSEEILGNLLANRRNEFFLATKYTNGSAPKRGQFITGNSRLAMIASVEASLRRLKTDRIDLYWVHHPDGITPIEEILRGFEDLARSGKIVYAGLSNFPAWRASRAVTLAELSQTVPISAIQVEYSLVRRSIERDHLPLAEALGLGVLTWSPLGGGMLTGKYRNGETGRAEGLGGRVFQAENSADRTAVLDTVLQIAAELETSPDRVALSWVIAKGVTPIIGPKTVEQLKSNLGAADLCLSDQQIARLDQVSAGALVDLPKETEGENGRAPLATGPRQFWGSVA